MAAWVAAFYKWGSQVKNVASVKPYPFAHHQPPQQSSLLRKLSSLTDNAHRLIHKQKTDSHHPHPQTKNRFINLLTTATEVANSSSSSPISKPNLSLPKPSISSITLSFLSSFLLNIKELMYKLRELNWSYSYLFGRKFVPDCLKPLMEIADNFIFRD